MMTTEQEASEAVERAGALSEQGTFPFSVYSAMRAALVHGHYRLVLRDFALYSHQGHSSGGDPLEARITDLERKLYGRVAENRVLYQYVEDGRRENAVLREALADMTKQRDAMFSNQTVQ